MRFTRTEIHDVVLVEPDVHRDGRGYFLETYAQAKYRAGGIVADFVQDNRSRSVRGTLRGLHAQRRRPQGKLLQVVEGEIYDVAVDLRPASPTRGRFVAVTLSGESHHQLWVPPGFAHGFCVLSETATVEYKVTEPYDPQDEIRIAWNDPALSIPWPVKDPILSAKDEAAPRLSEVEPTLRLPKNR
jgi:dTDP-4-dehydrorhamnose 3,5-epimerase